MDINGLVLCPLKKLFPGFAHYLLYIRGSVFLLSDKSEPQACLADIGIGRNGECIKVLKISVGIAINNIQPVVADFHTRKIRKILFIFKLNISLYPSDIIAVLIKQPPYIAVKTACKRFTQPYPYLRLLLLLQGHLVFRESILDFLKGVFKTLFRKENKACFRVGISLLCALPQRIGISLIIQ